MTIAEFRAAGLSVQGRTPRRSKYGATKVVWQGQTFDSLGELAHYKKLLMREKAGEIRDLKTQVLFELVPKQGKIRPVTYRADFVYCDSEGNQVVEDFKSRPTRTKDYRIKKKLMLSVHGIEVQEVFADPRR